MPVSEHGRELLPPVLAGILDVAGPEAVRAIVENYGGCRVLIPMRANSDNWLTRIVSPDQARAIIERLGGGIPVDMPLGTRWMAAQRMAELEDRALPTNVIARTLGITERTVRGRRARARQNGKS